MTATPSQNVLFLTNNDAEGRIYWDAPITVGEPNVIGPGAAPQATVTPDGTVHLVWIRRDAPEGEIAKNSYLIYREFDGNVWSEPQTLLQEPISDGYLGKTLLDADKLGRLLWYGQCHLLARPLIH